MDLIATQLDGILPIGSTFCSLMGHTCNTETLKVQMFVFAGPGLKYKFDPPGPPSIDSEPFLIK